MGSTSKPVRTWMGLGVFLLVRIALALFAFRLCDWCSKLKGRQACESVDSAMVLSRACDIIRANAWLWPSRRMPHSSVPTIVSNHPVAGA